MAIVYDVSSPRGGILAATELGVISSHGEPFWIPIDRYGVLHEHATVREALSQLKIEILMGTYNPDTEPRITLQQLHRVYHEGVPGVDDDDGDEDEESDEEDGNNGNGCTCQNNKCSGRCRCRRDRVACTARCRCAGHCNNPANVVHADV